MIQFVLTLLLCSITTSACAASSKSSDSPLSNSGEIPALEQAVPAASAADSSLIGGQRDHISSNSASPSDTESGTIALRLLPQGELRLDTGPGKPWWADAAPAIAAAISGLVGLFGVFVAVSSGNRNALTAATATQRASEASLWQKANENELREHQSKLDKFYGPFLQKSLSNFLIASDLRARSGGVETYRLLVKLFDQEWKDGLSDGDRCLVALICDNAVELEKFIAANTGMVDSQITEYLARASAHYRIIYLAFKGKLGSDPAPFEKYTYPRELDRVLELEIARIHARCTVLRENPGSCPGLMPALLIPQNLKLPNWSGDTPIDTGRKVDA